MVLVVLVVVVVDVVLIDVVAVVVVVVVVAAVVVVVVVGTFGFGVRRSPWRFGWGRSVVGCAVRLVGWGWSGVVCAWGWGGGVGRSWFVREGLEFVGWGWSVVVCAVAFGVGGLGLVGCSLRCRVWGWWVVVCGEGYVGPSVVCAFGVGWGWSVVVYACGFGVGGLGLVGRGGCRQV